MYAALGPVGARIARNFSMQALANVCGSVLETSVVESVDGVGATDLSEASTPRRDYSAGGRVTPSTRWFAVVGAEDSLRLRNTGRLGLRAEPRAMS